MKTPSALFAFVLAATMPALCAAQKPALTTEVTPPRSSSPVNDHLLGKVDFVGVPLQDAIDYFKDACPGFQAVIVHDPSCPDANPMLPNMSLKSLPLSQILEVIGKALPDLKVEKVSSRKGGNVWIFRVHGPAGANDASKDAGRPTMMVYRLSHLITALDRPKALNDVLSLLQAALDASNCKEVPLLKVHAATETLIFKGVPVQQEVVKHTLKALEPTAEEIASSNQFAQTQAVKAEVTRLKEIVKAAQDDLTAARAIINRQASEIEILQRRLQASGSPQR